MEASQALPAVVANLESRKLNLIELIVGLSDPEILALLEEILSPENMQLDEPEIALLEERIARYRANLRNVTPFEIIYQKIANRSK